MSDLNVSATIGSPIDYYKFEILRDVVNVKDAWEHYYKNKDLFQTDLVVITARTRSLFSSLIAYLGRKWKENKKFEEIKKKLFSSTPLNENDLREIFFDIQIQLDSDNITKLDTKNKYDGTRVELENKEFGL